MTHDLARYLAHILRNQELLLDDLGRRYAAARDVNTMKVAGELGVTRAMIEELKEEPR